MKNKPPMQAHRQSTFGLQNAWLTKMDKSGYIINRRNREQKLVPTFLHILFWEDPRCFAISRLEFSWEKKMQTKITLLLLATYFAATRAVTMDHYRPSSDVEPEFKGFLESIYSSAENPTSTTDFTNFFTPTGTLIVLSYTAHGSDEIIKLKDKLLPPDGHKQWNHLPNITTVYSDKKTKKIFDVSGVIFSTYTGGNCSAAYYKSRFTVLKNSDSSTNLDPHSGSLVLYDDYYVYPDYSPTEIPCVVPHKDL